MKVGVAHSWVAKAGHKSEMEGDTIQSLLGAALFTAVRLGECSSYLALPHNDFISRLSACSSRKLVIDGPQRHETRGCTHEHTLQRDLQRETSHDGPLLMERGPSWRRRCLLCFDISVRFNMMSYN